MNKVLLGSVLGVLIGAAFNNEFLGICIGLLVAILMNAKGGKKNRPSQEYGDQISATILLSELSGGFDSNCGGSDCN